MGSEQNDTKVCTSHCVVRYTVASLGSPLNEFLDVYLLNELRILNQSNCLFIQY